MAQAPFRVLRGEGGEPDAELALVDALLRGEPGAELAAWNRFSPAVDRTLRRLMGPGPDREDLVQEVFIRFFRRVGTLRERSAVRAFLTGICVHVVQAEIARRRRGRWLQLTPAGELPEPATRDGDTESREAVKRYYRLLERLKEKERSIFVARTIEGLTLEEVAEAHGVSVSTAQRRINHATKRIATLVRKDPLLVQFATRGQS
jgi:RNA polymerase sigma-70 factor (ECF subfamily)